MHRERLEQMVVMLRNLPPEGPGFDIGTWRCGTTACAVGHACLNPVFQEQGFEWNKRHREPVFHGILSWPAVELFFGLTKGQAEHFFYSASYSENDPTANDVADRIERFLAQHAEPA
jgi:hypothetical protein